MAKGAKTGLLLKLMERLPESLDCDVVEERRELRFPVLACCLTYTVERTGRDGPALGPGRVLLGRVSRCRAPSLHRLRGREGDLVRQLRRYYGPV